MLPFMRNSPCLSAIQRHCIACVDINYCILLTTAFSVLAVFCNCCRMFLILPRKCFKNVLKSSVLQLMQLSIFAITIPRAPPGICPHPGAFASKLLPGRCGFVGAAPEGRAFVYQRYLPFLEFSI